MCSCTRLAFAPFVLKVTLVNLCRYDPIPIKRAWCLWEIMCALVNQGVNFVVRLPASQRQLLTQGLMDDSRSIIQALSDVQAEKATAFKDSDKVE